MLAPQNPLVASFFLASAHELTNAQKTNKASACLHFLSIACDFALGKNLVITN